MGLSQTKSNLRWGFLLFIFLCSASSWMYAIADEASLSGRVAFDDTDTDGLSNEEEKIYGTDPDVADTDGDGYSDGIEIEGGFDPLKSAPGDRVVVEEVQEVNTDIDTQVMNLTDQATEELIGVISEKGTDAEITSEDLNAVITKLSLDNQEEIVLPEVDTSLIKIKQLESGLSEEDLLERKRQDTVEYLTLVSYILISNAPIQIRDSQALKAFMLDAGKQVVMGLATGDYSYLDDLEERSKKALDEVNDVEVPENMLDTHVKAVKMLAFASNLKQSLKITIPTDDPLGQMLMFSKIQGFLMAFDTFTSETQNKLVDIGVENIPLDI